MAEMFPHTLSGNGQARERRRGTAPNRRRVAASCLASLVALVLAAPASAAPDEGEAIERQANALVAAIGEGADADLQGLVGDRVLLTLPGRNNHQRSTPAAMLESLRACSHHLTKRFPGEVDEIFVLYVCRGLPRGAIMEEEEPGYVLRLWRHSLGLAVAYSQSGVQVRPMTRVPAMPAKAPPAQPLSVGAEQQRAAAERFVALVRSGQDAIDSEFGEALAAADAAKLRAMAPCEPGPPRTSDGGGSVLIMWDCPDQPEDKGIGTMLSFSDGRVTSIFVMGAVIVKTGSR